MNAVTINNLCKSFDTGWGKKRTILKDLTLAIKENEIFGYLGANGAGKTTTFKLILGLIHADRGEIFFWDKSAFHHKNRALLGYLPENPYFYSYLTAAESLNFYAGLFNMDTDTKKRRIDKLLSLVELDHARNLQLRKFSRGMLQRVGIAQALINDPKLLILDEPMSGLDPMGRKKMRDIILTCQSQGKTIIFSTHIISDVESICDRASILSAGELKKVVDIDGLIDSGDSYWEIICHAKTTDFQQSGILDTVLEGIDADAHGIIKTITSGNRTVLITADKAVAYALMNQIKTHNLDLISFGPRRNNLEDIYIKATGQTGNGTSQNEKEIGHAG